MSVSTEGVQLRCVSSDIVVVTFKEGLKGRPTFSKDYKDLEDVMKLVGIAIPVFAQSEYVDKTKPDRRAVHLSDEDFGKAFYELYWKANMNPKEFVWEKIPSK